ncbi:MAG: prolipoprotein diacylglyceryl transferase [Leptospirales bacterium]|nr:prolipoprotein diacylglyceryl transferase [Leptospirales bacterium]
MEQSVAHFPVMLGLGPLRVHPHFLFEMLAYLLGFRYYLSLRRKTVDAVDPQVRLWTLVGAASGALLGSRLLAALEHLDWFSFSWHSLWLLYSTKTIVGGLLGGWIGVELCKRWIGERRSTGDIYVRPLIAAIAIGRVGCFLTGVSDATTGLPTDSIFGLDQGDGLRRHPAALYEILFLAALWLCFVALEHPSIGNIADAWPAGRRFQYFLFAYLSFRLLIDFLKPRYELALGLSAIQWASLAGLLYYSGFWLARSLQPPTGKLTQN